MRHHYPKLEPIRPRWHGWYYGLKSGNAIGLCDNRPWYCGLKYKDGKNYYEHSPIIRARRVLGH